MKVRRKNNSAIYLRIYSLKNNNVLKSTALLLNFNIIRFKKLLFIILVVCNYIHIINKGID